MYNNGKIGVPMKNKIYPYLASIALVIIVTFFGMLLRKTIAPTNIVIFYLLIVVMTAVWWGRGPAVMVSFLSVLVFDYFLFFLFRTALYHFVDVKAVPALSKWGGLVTGFLRDILLIGLIIFAFSISSVTYLANSANKSYIASRFSKVAPATYSWIWNNITSKFIPSEKFNNAVLEDK